MILDNQFALRSRKAVLGAVVALGGVAALALGDGGFAPAAKAQELDLNKVFWCDREDLGGQTPEDCAATRDLIMSNCTGCHTFVPVVKAQKDEAGWDGLMNAHRQRLAGVSEEDFNKISTFLKVHYNPQNEPPQLPPELEALSDIPQ